ncbi:MAG: DUF86 domain-containing protein [Gammaproteobacteria bacterium]|nr:DUF86 domain-containing protein [Gammaproteobacteria bacterium]
MLTKKELGLLLYIIKHCKRIEEKVFENNQESFLENEDVKEIICFNIFQIGELAKNFSKEFLLKYNEVSWKEIKGMRDWVGHGYETVDLGIIWKTAVEDIKPLRSYCEKIIEDNE